MMLFLEILWRYKYYENDKLLLKLMSTRMPEKKLSLTHMKIIISFMVVFKIVIINYESLMLELFYVQWET